MHILYLSSPGGGLDTYVREIGRELSCQGHRVSVAYLHTRTGKSIESDHDAGIEVHHGEVRNLHYYVHLATFGTTSIPRAIRNVEYSLGLHRLLGRIIQDAKIDLIELPEMFVTPRYARGIPYVIRLHSSDWTWRLMLAEGEDLATRLEKKLECLALRGARGISSPSLALASFIGKTCKLPPSGIQVIPGPIDVERFKPAPRDGRENVVLFVGRVERRKGAHLLFEAIPQVKAVLPDCKFVFAGRLGDEFSSLPALDAGSIRLLGSVPRDELISWYQRATILVAPSLWDNSPNTVCEAMACGTPVVASRVGGIPELVEDGETGVLVPPNDSDALAQAICRLLTNPGLREKMAARSREKAAVSFASRQIANVSLSFYQSLLERNTV